MGPIRRIEGDVHATLARVNQFIDNAENGITLQLKSGSTILPFSLRVIVDEKAAEEQNPDGAVITFPVETVLAKLAEVFGKK